VTLRLLRRVAPADLFRQPRPRFDADTLTAAAAIVADVRERGEVALLDHAARLGDWTAGTPWTFEKPALLEALDSVDPETLRLLTQAATRIRAFAEAQRSALRDIDVPVDGGRAGHMVFPLQRAGCYAPAGRFPLVSSLLMTVVTAKAAGVAEVWVATPRPGPAMLAAAAIAGADGVLGIGGAQAIAALAYGAGPVAPCDIVVGPGNRWVTAAKRCVAGDVAIDFLAGPSELVVVADAAADPATIASDLLAQAEHDVDALPVLVTTDRALASRVESEFITQLATLPTAATARAALAKGMVVHCRDLEEVIAVCETLAPEHLQLSVAAPAAIAARMHHAGAIFLGEHSGEVFGDYGIGPNHVLPTGAGARFTGGLSVLTFLRVRTWLDVRDAAAISSDIAALARLEGLEGHARAAERRRSVTQPPVATL
jgi:phosphoribosyl-ATP pyrophosphohydrolase/phosphoribosyl-AMP cyclohydrolase/histidinol dehydrogenase